MLSEKITGGPSGPLAVVYFFSKKPHKQVRADNSPNYTLNKGQRFKILGNKTLEKKLFSPKGFC